MSPYDRIAPFYDILADTYSFGAIRASQNAHLRHLMPKERVLYVGCGSSRNFRDAPADGRHVTFLDLSTKMLRLTDRTLRDLQASSFELVQRDFFLHSSAEPYDVIVLPFVLNVFSRTNLDRALVHADRLLAAGGRVEICDFSAPDSRRARRLLQTIHYWFPLTLFRWLTANPEHELYDYPAVIEGLKLPWCLIERTRFGLGSFFEALSFTKAEKASR